ncbi:MAG: hypothetical protein LBT86_01500 [Deltaproteobacteria bacterium]|nr:hypothetical protein [Deltaproteobacteria bacterium]
MKVPCSACGSTNTVIMSSFLPIGGKSWLSKLVQGLAKVTQSIRPRAELIMGRRTVVCRDCGYKMVIYFN